MKRLVILLLLCGCAKTPTESLYGKHSQTGMTAITLIGAKYVY